jgi:Leucine-rich repeat (LRR) protein
VSGVRVRSACVWQAFPGCLCRCPLLEHLDLSENRIPSVPDAISNLRGLRRLLLYGNLLHELPDALAACKSITELNVFNNRCPRVDSATLRLFAVSRACVTRRACCCAD